MAGIYRTYIDNTLGALSADLLTKVQAQLMQLFGQCLGGKYDSNQVVLTGAALPNGAELLVYFMPSDKSILKRMPNCPSYMKAPNWSPNTDATIMGRTLYASPPNGSEVYVRNSNPTLLAKLAFHELMHNRLKLGDAQLHPKGGLASADISPDTQLTPGNISDMSAVIDTALAQWTDGIGILKTGKFDPLSEYYQV